MPLVKAQLSLPFEKAGGVTGGEKGLARLSLPVHATCPAWPYCSRRPPGTSQTVFPQTQTGGKGWRVASQCRHTVEVRFSHSTRGGSSMKSQLHKLFVTTAILALIVASCATPTPQTIVETQVVEVVNTQVVVQTQQVEVVVTATAAPVSGAV